MRQVLSKVSEIKKKMGETKNPAEENAGKLFKKAFEKMGKEK